MVSKKVKIRNDAGIHVRPSGIIVGEAKKYDGTITVSAKGEEADARNIMELLALGLCKDDEAVLYVNGPNEKKICDKLARLFCKKFDFPPRGE